jgi:hypothetical protein
MWYSVTFPAIFDRVIVRGVLIAAYGLWRSVIHAFGKSLRQDALFGSGFVEALP